MVRVTAGLAGLDLILLFVGLCLKVITVEEMITLLAVTYSPLVALLAGLGGIYMADRRAR